MSYVSPNDWTPSLGILLDGKALEIVKSNKSLSILAGPGAGKTELLAQKAAYLLTTGLCPPPLRILAISFKVDAARNLLERVSKRCESAQHRRFESITIDSFAKRIVDQFAEALPANLRPSPNYKIMYASRHTWDEFRDSHGNAHPIIRSLNNTQLEHLIFSKIPDLETNRKATELEQAHAAWWKEALNTPTSLLTFDMIKLLASFILKSQPTVLSALRETYAHAFLDEFQDVTDLQYSLIKSAFLGSDTTITAVGDSKQAIMRWAGARRDIFERLESDFKTKEEKLLYNFRSNKRVVELINSLASTFEPDYIPTICARKEHTPPPDSIRAIYFKNRQSESEFLASFISNELQKKDVLKPEDFVILSRIRINDVEDRIKGIFSSHGLKIRNEARTISGIAIQDLVKERAYIFMLAALKLAVNVRTGHAFQDCRDTIADLLGYDISSERGHSASLNGTRNLVDTLREKINARAPADVTGTEIANHIMDHFEIKYFQRSYKEYATTDRLNSTIAGFTGLLDECRKDTPAWAECIEEMEGENAVKLMTIHKSKGLEYHTVIFTELNDDTFWGNEDDVNVFFVALSRAKERVYFTTSGDNRGTRNTKVFYDKLKEAGVSLESM